MVEDVYTMHEGSMDSPPVMTFSIERGVGEEVVDVYILHEASDSRYALFVGQDQDTGFRIQPTPKIGVSLFYSGRAVLVRTGKREEGTPELKSISRAPIVEWMRRPDDMPPYELVAMKLKPDGRSTIIPKRPKVCVQCKKEYKELKACGRCKQTLYCSRDCQRKHWKVEHRLSCKPLDLK